MEWYKTEEEIPEWNTLVIGVYITNEKTAIAKVLYTAFESLNLFNVWKSIDEGRVSYERPPDFWAEMKKFNNGDIKCGID